MLRRSRKHKRLKKEAPGAPIRNEELRIITNNASFGRSIRLCRNRIAGAKRIFLNNFPVGAQLHPVAGGIQPQSGDVRYFLTTFLSVT